jgi:hypothetical protein
MLMLYVLVQSSAVLLLERWTNLARRRRQEAGQASAEYALVLLGAAAVALLVTSWAARTNRVGRLLDGVMDRLLSHVR